MCFIWRISREVTYVILLGYGIIFLITNLLLKALYQFKERILANEEAMKHKTVIAIAHRLSSVRNVDRIIVFHKGEIVGQGRFEELLENNEYFRRLYEASANSTRMDS